MSTWRPGPGPTYGSLLLSRSAAPVIRPRRWGGYRRYLAGATGVAAGDAGARVAGWWRCWWAILHRQMPPRIRGHLPSIRVPDLFRQTGDSDGFEVVDTADQVPVVDTGDQCPIDDPLEETSWLLGL